MPVKRLWTTTNKNECKMSCKNGKSFCNKTLFAKIDKDRQSHIRNFCVVQRLSTIYIFKFFHCFQFYDDFIITNEIWNESRGESNPFINSMNLHFALEGYAPFLKLNRQSLLIHFFCKPSANSIMHRHCCPDNLVGFLRVYQIFSLSFHRHSILFAAACGILSNNSSYSKDSLL